MNQAKHVRVLVDISHEDFANDVAKTTVPNDSPLWERTALVVEITVDLSGEHYFSRSLEWHLVPIFREECGVWCPPPNHKYAQELEMALAGNNRLLDQIAEFLARAKELNVSLLDYEGATRFPLPIHPDAVRNHCKEVATTRLVFEAKKNI